MKYISTLDSTKTFSLSECLLQGLAPDGGLFVPESFPIFNPDDFSTLPSYEKLCEKVLTPFFEGDKLEGHLTSLCQQAFTFDVPLNQLNENTYILELFHGPTLSFKDFGARFLATCLNELAEEKITIMVATSGDTGSAVAAAFHQKPNIDVIVLFPEGKISERQQHQISCWGDNITALAVKGTFDDCQHLTKAAFSDPWWKENTRLCTSNSINIGRLLPQTCYYAYNSLRIYQEQGVKANFVVPSGNLGNVTAAFWAKEMGFPIGSIVIACNANRVVCDYLDTGEYKPQKSIETLANAMDVGKPSNFERLDHLFKDHSTFNKRVTAYSVDDELIKQTIKKQFDEHKLIVCPHTATGCWVREQLSDAVWIVVGTAHPCKFESTIEPIIGQAVPIDPALAKLLKKSSHYTIIEPKLTDIEALLKAKQAT